MSRWAAYTDLSVAIFLQEVGNAPLSWFVLKFLDHKFRLKPINRFRTFAWLFVLLFTSSNACWIPEQLSYGCHCRVGLPNQGMQCKQWDWSESPGWEMAVHRWGLTRWLEQSCQPIEEVGGLSRGCWTSSRLPKMSCSPMRWADPQRFCTDNMLALAYFAHWKHCSSWVYINYRFRRHGPIVFAPLEAARTGLWKPEEELTNGHWNPRSSTVSVCWVQVGAVRIAEKDPG